MTTSSPQPTGYSGFFRGLVMNNVDPAGMGRLTALVPQLFGNTTTETEWALPATPVGYSQASPSPGEGVWITFEGGDLNYPIWVGTWQAPPPAPAAPVVPIGGSIDWYSDVLPPDPGIAWLFLHGQTVTNGATLYPLIVPRYPNWVSGNNLVLPDTRNQVPMGAGGSYQPGVTGGQSSVVLTTSNLPEVSGTTNIEDATHTHDTLIANNPVLFVAFDQSTLGLSAPGDRSATYGLNQTTDVENQEHQHAYSFGNASPTPVATVPPFIAVQKIVRVA